MSHSVKRFHKIKASRSSSSNLWHIHRFHILPIVKVFVSHHFIQKQDSSEFAENLPHLPKIVDASKCAHHLAHENVLLSNNFNILVGR